MRYRTDRSDDGPRRTLTPDEVPCGSSGLRFGSSLPRPAQASNPTLVFLRGQQLRAASIRYRLKGSVASSVEVGGELGTEGVEDASCCSGSNLHWCSVSTDGGKGTSSFPERTPDKLMGRLDE